jgi:exodeoxyribonuclease VII small subunit
MSKTLSYKDAIQRIKQLTQQIENNDNDLDVLLEQVKEAKGLLVYCEEKLKVTEAEIIDLFSEEEE